MAIGDIACIVFPTFAFDSSIDPNDRLRHQTAHELFKGDVVIVVGATSPDRSLNRPWVGREFLVLDSRMRLGWVGSASLGEVR